MSVNNRQKPEPDEEYTINNTYLGKAFSYSVVIDKILPYEDYVSGKVFIDKQAIIPIPPIKKIVKVKQSLHKIEL